MPQPAPPITYTHLVSLFTTQLIISIHTILAAREIYPARTFIRARAYNLPVQQSRHPDVCKWINDAVAAVETELLKGTVARVVLVIFETAQTDTGSDTTKSNSEQTADHRARPLERYVWDVSRFPAIPETELHTPFTRSSTGGDAQAGQENPPAPETAPVEEQRARFQASLGKMHSDLHEQFRGLLARLSTISTKLIPLPKSDLCSYTLCVELKEEADPPIRHPQPWIPSERESQRRILHPKEDETEATKTGNGAKESTETVKEGQRLVERGGQLGGAKTTLVRTVDEGEMTFEMWIEEGKAKLGGPTSKLVGDDGGKGN